MTISNGFTLARVLLAPVFLIIYNLPVWFNSQPGSPLSVISVCIAIPLLAFAELTDFFDGFFARKRNEVSDFGKVFDPFADVLLHLTTFTSFMNSGYCPLIIFILILYREFTMTLIRMVAAKKGVAIAARKGGKLKTVFYVISGFFSLMLESFTRFGMSASGTVNMPLLKNIGFGLYVICLILAYASFIDYIKNFGSVLKNSDK